MANIYRELRIAIQHNGGGTFLLAGKLVSRKWTPERLRWADVDDTRAAIGTSRVSARRMANAQELSLQSGGSLWYAALPSPAAAPVRTHRAGVLEVDVAIVGAGITGLTAATLLRDEGKSVAVVERASVGAGESGHTTAHLTELYDSRYYELESDFGETGARLAADCARGAIDHIGRWADRFPCDFERAPGFLYAEAAQDTDGNERKNLERELTAAARAGLRIAEAREFPLGIPVSMALRVENQAYFHPTKYLTAMARELRESGGHLLEGVQVTEIADGEPCGLTTDGGVQILARDVLVCANAPLNRIALHPKLAAYRTYAIAARVKLPPPPGLYFDSYDPYHYLRTQVIAGETLLIVGGEDHKVGVEDKATGERYERLIEFADARFGVTSVPHRWSGQILEPADGLAYIGRNSGAQHVYVATGYSGTGITLGTTAAHIMVDALNGRPNPYAELFDATRIHAVASAAQVIETQADVTRHLIGGLFRGLTKHVEDVRPGEGKIVSLHGKRLAVYRAEDGTVNALDPTCRHLGCQVAWNGAERSWDCPCHGGRYDITGKVLNGPPLQPLKVVAIDPDDAGSKPER